MSRPAAQEAGRHAWAEPGVEDLGGGVYRIPLPLPGDALRAVNVYALADGEGVDLIDAGMALAQARERLTAALREIGCELGDVRNFLITHVHRDHYTLAVELRRAQAARRGTVSLGEGERANLQAIRDIARGFRERDFAAELRRMGATNLAAPLGTGPGNHRPDAAEWEDPDRWLTDGAELGLRSRTLHAIHTPGHTRGHLVFHDAPGSLLFAGDHVLPHITPSIGLEPVRNRMALRDYLSSLRLILTLPDARLLPAHGPVRDSAHQRVHELLAHHEDRLGQTGQAVMEGARTAYETARALRWTRRRKTFTELDPVNQWMAVGETAAHLEVLVARGQLTRRSDPDGTDRYTPVAAAPRAGTGMPDGQPRRGW
ncbi:MAG TPA: MBL fold metallo-hydrolase [Streptosporangiaceae bacterium]|nr:MBL fold metallo-hydrolase [Streptosporangiaceae bacterium]